MNYGIALECGFCFLCGCLSIAYLFACYLAVCLLSIELATIAYDNLQQYNRGSLFRHSLFKLRCLIRDLWEGHRSMPHLLQSYMLICFLWSVLSSAVSGSWQLASILIFVVRLLLRGRHYGVWCRPISAWTALFVGLLAGIPRPLLLSCIGYEILFPTMGLGEDFAPIIGDRGDDCLHPGYAGTDLLLDGLWHMARDGLCLYHCLVAAANLNVYRQCSQVEREAMAEALRTKTIR